MTAPPTSAPAQRISPLLTAVRNHYRPAIVVVVLFPIIALAMALMSTPTYESTAKVLISTRDLAGAIAGVSDTGLDDSSDIATEAQIAALPSVIRTAKENLGVASGPALDAQVDLRVPGAAGSLGTSNLLDIVVVSSDRRYSEDLAGAVAEAYVAFRRDLATRDVRTARQDLAAKLDQLEETGLADSALFNELSSRQQLLDTLLILGSSRASLLEPGSPAEQVSPRPARSAVLGLLLGCVVAIALAVGLQRLDRHPSSHEEIGEILGIPVLGGLSDPRRSDRLPNLVALAGITSPGAEAFRALRLNVKFAMAARSSKTLIITSANPGEGKTFVATNLALAAAASGADVILVDLDLRKPAVHSYLGIQRTVGISDVIAGDTTLEDALVTVALPEGAAGDGRLRVLPAGRRVPNPGEFAASPSLAAEIRRLAASKASLVIIDTPPLFAVSDATALVDVADATAVVVRADEATRADLRRLREMLASGTHSILGVALTAAWNRRSSYDQPYVYAYGDDDAAEAQPETGGRRAGATPQSATDTSL